MVLRSAEGKSVMIIQGSGKSGCHGGVRSDSRSISISFFGLLEIFGKAGVREKQVKVSFPAARGSFFFFTSAALLGEVSQVPEGAYGVAARVATVK